MKHLMYKHIQIALKALSKGFDGHSGGALSGCILVIDCLESFTQ
jgi:hypothetical protein